MPADPDDILDLWRQYQADRSLTLRNRLVEHYVPLAERAAMKLHKQLREGEFLDFRSAAMIGLIDAVEKFQPDRGIRFSTYSTLRVRGAIIDDLRRQWWLPRCAKQRVQAWADAEERFTAARARRPSEEEIAGVLNVPATQYRDERRALAAQMHSMNAYTMDGEEDGEEVFSQSTEVDPLDRAGVLDDVDQLLARLTPRHRRLIELRYLREMPYAEIGRALGITDSCACATVGSIRAALKGKLRQKAA